MLKIKADEYLEGLVQQAYEDGYKAGVKATKAARTKELNELKKQLETIQKACDNLGDEAKHLAGQWGTWE